MENKKNGPQNIDEISAKKICGYIDKVCAESAASEGRQNDVKWQFCFIGNYMIFAMKTGYIRVYRRIMYRLQNNIEKNFKVFFKPIPNGNEFLAWDDKFKGFDFFPIENGIDPNFSFTDWNIFGEYGTLRASFRDKHLLNPHVDVTGTKFASKHYQDLCALHNAESYLYFSWEEYCRDFKKLYGYEPYKIKKTFHN